MPNLYSSWRRHSQKLQTFKIWTGAYNCSPGVILESARRAFHTLNWNIQQTKLLECDFKSHFYIVCIIHMCVRHAIAVAHSNMAAFVTVWYKGFFWPLWPQVNFEVKSIRLYMYVNVFLLQSWLKVHVQIFHLLFFTLHWGLFKKSTISKFWVKWLQWFSK